MATMTSGDEKAGIPHSAPETDRARREGLTVALYISLVLAGEFVAVSYAIETKQQALALIWGTALGLTLTHVFAFNLAARAFEGGRLSDETRISIGYQVALGMCVALILSLPLLFFPVSTALDISSYLVAGMVGITSFAVARAGKSSRAGAVGFAAAMLALGVVVVSVKVLVSH